MNTYLQTAIDAAPQDTYGLVIAPWTPFEVYGVAANWAQASAPVYFYGPEGWRTQQYQVADFRHEPSEALEAEIIQALTDSGDGDSEAKSIVEDATEFTALSPELQEITHLLTGLGDRFSGNNAKDMGQEWLDQGFDANSARDWCDIGVWDPATAATLRDAELTPQEVKDAADRLIEAEETRYVTYTDGCPIYSCCNNDTRCDVLIEEAKGE